VRNASVATNWRTCIRIFPLLAKSLHPRRKRRCLSRFQRTRRRQLRVTVKDGDAHCSSAARWRDTRCPPYRIHGLSGGVLGWTAPGAFRCLRVLSAPAPFSPLIGIRRAGLFSYHSVRNTLSCFWNALKAVQRPPVLLRRGEMMILDNLHWLHGGTHFADKQRHLLRLRIA
jgi:hypothetical protein